MAVLLASTDGTRMRPMSAQVYPCYSCGALLRPADIVVRTVKLDRRETASGEKVEQWLVGEWFHARCWDHFGGPPFDEVARGPLSEVQDLA
jgi:hypothetical protein